MKGIFLTIMIGFVAPQIGNAQQRGPNLTDEQRACMEQQVGTPGQGNRPSREAIDAAMKTCGIERMSFKGPEGRHHGPRLTDEQRSCVESHVGAPGQGDRPSREEMQAALSACGVQLPSQASGDSAEGVFVSQ